MIEENLENFRKTYIVSTKSSHGNFEAISSKLGSQNQPNSFAKKTVAVLLALILLSGSAIGAAQASSPASPLYPLKLISDDVIYKITGSQQFKVEKRAQEVIDSKEGSQKEQEEALKQYQKTLEQTKEDAQKSGTTEQFRNTLDTEENKFKNAQATNPSQHLEQAIQHTENAKGDVKGKKDQNQNYQDPGQNNPASNSDHNQANPKSER